MARTPLAGISFGDPTILGVALAVVAGAILLVLVWVIVVVVSGGRRERQLLAGMGWGVTRRSGSRTPGWMVGGRPRPARLTVEERLRELDDLYRRGMITAQEHVAAQARILSASSGTPGGVGAGSAG
ncbi:MAG: SHOCT domain-containing protein [Actinomycetales bacterium]|nr:SHOCT domain-containing protein [Actinomycetales bacterium]